jgi:hypothetical protein
MKTKEQLRAKYERFEGADKALREFLTTWEAEHGISFEEVSQLLEAAQMDAEGGDLSYKELSVDEILSDTSG